MSNFLDGIQPGNRRILVNGVQAPEARDTLDFVCIGATVSDDAGRQETRIALPASGSGPTEWVAFTPTLSSSGGGFSLGNGSVQAFWRQVSTDVIELQLGLQVGSTTNFGAGYLKISFSIPAAGGEWRIDTAKIPLGTMLPDSTAFLTDISTPANARNGILGFFDDKTVTIVPTSAGAFVSGTVPFTWAVNDLLQFAASLPAHIVGL